MPIHKISDHNSRLPSTISPTLAVAFHRPRYRVRRCCSLLHNHGIRAAAVPAYHHTRCIHSRFQLKPQESPEQPMTPLSKKRALFEQRQREPRLRSAKV